VALVYLVGFMGAGKTVVGRRLAELLGRPFLDLDQEIERREGITVSEIFRRHGEKHFRALELEELVLVSTLEDAVIAVGGGAYCRPEDHAVMERTGITIWLDAPIEILYARCRGIPDSRPLLTSMEEMARLLEQRRPFYSQARLRIEAGGDPVEALAWRIQASLRGMEGEVLFRENSLPNGKNSHE